MLSKSQSISVRLSTEDYAYLMKIDRNGAITQSEKVRELIALSRDSVGTESFSRAYIASSETLAPFKAKYKDEPESRSILIEATFDLITDSIAAIQSSSQTKEFNAQLESKLAPNIDAFIERLLPVMSDQGSVINQEHISTLKSRLINLAKTN